MLTTSSFFAGGQSLYKYEADDAFLVFADKQQSQYVPHIMKSYWNAKALHGNVWGSLPTQPPYMVLADMEDDGNAGVSSIPHNYILIGLSPLNKSYFTSPSSERYDYAFKHEYTHAVMQDKPNVRDERWRRFTRGKIAQNSEYPLSALWSYLDVPRMFCPRWYQEGIACFMETWLNNGIGRSLSGLDEAYFRSNVFEGKKLYSVVGLETEGSTSDYRLGGTGYLYGTRFVNYLVLTYGYDKLITFYNRTPESKASYVSQFRKVYRKSIRDVWQDWIDFENAFQKENLKRIAEYPLTEMDRMTDGELGAMSPMIVDCERHVAYAAMNKKGDFAQIARFRLDESNKHIDDIERLAYIDGNGMHMPAYIAYDKAGQRIIWTDKNQKYRGLVVYDLIAGKVVKRLNLQRVADICYDNRNDCLWGVFTNRGVSHIVRYDRTLEEKEVLYSFPFGVSVSDLDVSHDGSKLVVAINEASGAHTLAMFNTEDLEKSIFKYEVLRQEEDSNLSQFRFSYDDSKLVGFSYYSGVPNIWCYDIGSKEMNLLSNVQTGLFAPYMASDSLLYAYNYAVEGMIPVTFEYKELHDANSIEFLGQKAYEANPQIAELSILDKDMKEIEFSDVYDSITEYNPLREIKLQSFYPDISAFTDPKAWNNITPVLGGHLSFFDPLSQIRINVFAGMSPWSNNEWKNKFHFSVDLNYKYWTLSGAWNRASFYDLFGPGRGSRKGYQISLGYSRSYSRQSSFSWGWSANAAHYGGMDELPLYQDIEVDSWIRSFQTASLYVSCGKTRTTTGGIEAEQGYQFSAQGYTYLADGKFFPSVAASGRLGFRLPFGGHNCFWLSTAAGHSFCSPQSSFGNSYFGGFRNNYVDRGSINRYRAISAMPGARINQICAHNYAKFTGELSFTPIRFNGSGALQCYPNYIQFRAFASELMADWWGVQSASRASYLSVGAQMNIPIVLFTHMGTTLSVGYARIWGNGLNSGELMISLNLL
ncbi:MAG: hypothetical protein KBT00_04180 [Bacteroidales bacterium]|nr:hypothetical protein [Candidatus Cacconaster merdequi]